MAKRLKVVLDDCGVSSDERKYYEKGLKTGEERLFSGKEDFTGWVKLPYEYNREEIEQVKEAAREIREKCDAFVVIGIGGSYLGAKAAVDMLTHSFANEMTETDGQADGNRMTSNTKTDVDSIPNVYFAGQNISGTYHKELLDIIVKKETCLCVISKSGTTTEPSIAFALLKDALVKKYGKKEAGSRIYAITDEKKGILRQEADKEGYVSFVVPDDIGGRYSVLTPVGLLPIAVAGIDIDEMLAGAASWKDGLEQCKEYAAVRNELLKKGKVVEIYECYEPKLKFFTEWLKQLFGESEGKGGKGIFPAALEFSTDLHSMGQFLQDGNQIFFETVLNVLEPQKDLTVPESAGETLAGKSVHQVNQAAVSGVWEAHKGAGIPMIRIDLPDLTPYTFGQMVYFFEMSCALSGYLLGVNPFDQPGVESYKAEMRKALGRQ